MKNPQQPLIDVENRCDGPYPQEVREQAQQAEATRNKRKRYEAMIQQCVADLKRLDAILSSPALDEEQETFLNIEHRAQSERLTKAEIFLKRYK